MKEEIEDRLEDLSENAEQLSRLQSKTEEDLEKDEVLKAGIERLLQVSIEIVLDISAMIISHEGLEKPDEYRKIIQKLGEEGVLEKEFSERFSKVAGLRNILVHRYAQIDDEKILENIRTNLDDFDEFSKQVAKYLEEK